MYGCRIAPGLVRAFAAALAFACAGCGRARPSVPAYHPRARDVTITAIPLLTKEMQGTYPFLKEDFARGGVLEGREVYSFEPSTVTVVAGDTVRLHLLNPEDDEHSFVLPGLAVRMPGQSVTRATYVAREPGVYAFTCSVPSHLPSMWGQLVVLAPSAVRPSNDGR